MSKVVAFPQHARLGARVESSILGRLSAEMAEAEKHFPVGTPRETIIKAMEEAKDGERFSMDVLIENDLDPEARMKADAARIAKKLENKSRF